MMSYNTEQQFLEAREELEYGEISKAKNLFEELIQDDPQYGRAYNYLGWIYHKYFSDYDRAWELYEFAIRFAPKFPISYLNHAQLLYEMEKFEELNYLLDRAIKVPGVTKSIILKYYGKLYEHNDNYELAIEYYEKGMKASTEEEDLMLFEESISRCSSKLNAGKRWNTIIA